ncbi:N-terminal part of RNA 2'-phosphotransferase KptA [Escherichia coli]|nr:N-terminal part of RNA 2'-phosphotransferase KptA [Escherichia coli]
MAKYNERAGGYEQVFKFCPPTQPEAIGIVLDREGWADIDKLILCAQKRASG